MSDYKSEFLEFIRTDLPDLHYENIPVFVRNAIYFEIDADEAKSILHDVYAGGSKGNDLDRYFNHMWKNLDGTIKTISEYKKDPKKNGIDLIKAAKREDEKLKKLQEDWDKEAAFRGKLFDLENNINIEDWIKKNYKKYDPTSNFMLKIFDKDDIVWASSDVISDNLRVEMKDILSWATKNEKLSRYRFFSINPYKDGSARTKTEIKKFKYMLFEADFLTKKEQLVMWIDLINHGLPVKMMTFTGNKSFHCLVKIPERITTLSQYEDYVGETFNCLNNLKDKLIDKNCQDACRLSRIPFGIRRDEKTDYEEREQKLYYLQEDDSKLKEDALIVVKNWVNSIWNNKTAIVVKGQDEVEDGEILSILDNRDELADIWNDGTFIHTLMKTHKHDANGKIIDYWDNVTWKNERLFLSHIRRLLEKQLQIKIDMKFLRDLRVNYKTAEKFPYIGERQPIKRDLVNVFIPGWLNEALNDPKIPATLNDPLKLLLKNLFGEDELAFRWTMQWMREFMHTFRVMTAPIFWSIQGTGKTMLAEAFAEAIGDWTKTPPKKDDIQFNSWIDKTVIIFEESSSGSKRDGKDLGDLLKDWLTGVEKTIEAKGKDPVKKTIRSCFIFNSNISDQVAPVYIEDSDRRFTVIRNDDATILTDLWTDEDYMRWNSGEYQKQLMKWIYNLPKDPKIDVRRGLDSKWKQEVIRMNKTNQEEALEEILMTTNGFISNEALIERMKREFGISTTAKKNGIILKRLHMNSVLQWDPSVGHTVRGYIFNANVEDLKKDANNVPLTEIDKIFTDVEVVENEDDE